jgi:hypothetical protein
VANGNNVRLSKLEKEVGQRKTLKIMLAIVNPAVLPALRFAGTLFLLINLAGGTYIFCNRHRFFDQDSNVDNDIPAVRKLRIEVVMVPWLVLTTLLVILLINLWRD